MPDTGHNDQPAVRHRGRHRPKIGRRDPAVPLAPEHQVRMPDLRHPPLQFAALPLAGEIDGVPIHMPSETPKVCSRMRSNSACDLTEPVAEPRDARSAPGFRAQTSEDAAVAMTARVISLLAIIERNRPI